MASILPHDFSVSFWQYLIEYRITEYVMVDDRFRTRLTDLPEE